MLTVSPKKCADIIFTDDLNEVPVLDRNNCFNSTDIEAYHVKVVRDTEAAPANGSDTASSIATRAPPTSSAPAAPVGTSGGERGPDAGASRLFGLSTLLVFLRLL